MCKLPLQASQLLLCTRVMARALQYVHAVTIRSAGRTEWHLYAITVVHNCARRSQSSHRSSFAQAHTALFSTVQNSSEQFRTFITVQHYTPAGGKCCAHMRAQGAQLFQIEGALAVASSEA